MDKVLPKKNWTNSIEPKDRKAPPKIKQESEGVCSCIGQCGCEASQEKSPYEKHKELGHKTTFYSPDAYSKVEECAECGTRYQHSPHEERPTKLSPLDTFKDKKAAQGTCKRCKKEGIINTSGTASGLCDSCEDDLLRQTYGEREASDNSLDEQIEKTRRDLKELYAKGESQTDVYERLTKTLKRLRDEQKSSERTAAQFGSVEWQSEMEKRVMEKKRKGLPLDDAEEAFVETQGEHNKRMVDEQARTSRKTAGQFKRRASTFNDEQLKFLLSWAAADVYSGPYTLQEHAVMSGAEDILATLPEEVTKDGGEALKEEVDWNAVEKINAIKSDYSVLKGTDYIKGGAMYLLMPPDADPVLSKAILKVMCANWDNKTYEIIMGEAPGDTVTEPMMEDLGMTAQSIAEEEGFILIHPSEGYGGGIFDSFGYEFFKDQDNNVYITGGTARTSRMVLTQKRYAKKGATMTKVALKLWERPSDYAGEEYPDYYVGPSQTRDSDTLERSNFKSALTELGGEKDGVIVARFGHWAVGWVETIFVHKDAKEKVAILERIESALSDYPVLDESDYSEMQSEEYAEDYRSWARNDAIKMIAKMLENKVPAEKLADLMEKSDRLLSDWVADQMNDHDDLDSNVQRAVEDSFQAHGEAFLDEKYLDSSMAENGAWKQIIDLVDGVSKEQTELPLEGLSSKRPGWTKMALKEEWEVDYLPNDSDNFATERGFESKKKAERWVEAENLRDKATDISITKRVDRKAAKDWETCTNCGGDGHVDGKECPACEGTGRLPLSTEASMEKKADEKRRPYITWDTGDIAENQAKYLFDEPESNDYWMDDEVKDTWEEAGHDTAKFKELLKSKGLEGTAEQQAKDDAYSDSDLVSIEWDSVVSDLSTFLAEKNPSGRWLVSVEGFGWRKLNGQKVVNTNDGQTFLREVLPDTDVTFYIYDDGDAKFSINNFHHDSPTGEWYYAEPAPSEEVIDAESSQKSWTKAAGISKQQQDAVEQSLSNDEASSDEELVEHFINEIKLSPEDAAAWVAKREHYLRGDDLKPLLRERNITAGKYRVVKNTTRGYGYALQDTTGEDTWAMGAGHTHGWYKYKSDAQQRADELNKSYEGKKSEPNEKTAGMVKRLVTAMEEMGIDDDADAKDPDAYLLGDQPMTCPKCGARTDFVEVPGAPVHTEKHTCPECKYTFTAEAEPEEDVYGTPEWMDSVMKSSETYYAKMKLVPDEEDLLGYIQDMADESGVEISMDEAAEQYHDWLAWKRSKRASLKTQADQECDRCGDRTGKSGQPVIDEAYDNLCAECREELKEQTGHAIELRKKADFADEHGIADEPAVEDLLLDETPMEPEEGDVIIQSEGSLGSETVAYADGKQIAKLHDDWDKFYGDIYAWMKKKNYYPNVWHMSDHGNVSEDTGFGEYVGKHPETKTAGSDDFDPEKCSCEAKGERCSYCEDHYREKTAGSGDAPSVQYYDMLMKMLIDSNLSEFQKMQLEDFFNSDEAEELSIEDLKAMIVGSRTAGRDEEIVKRNMEQEQAAVDEYRGQAQDASPKLKKVLDHIVEQEEEHKKEFEGKKIMSAEEGAKRASPSEAKKIITQALQEMGVTDARLKAKSVSFQDLARDSMVFVTVYISKSLPNQESYGQLEQLARANGFRVNFERAVAGRQAADESLTCPKCNGEAELSGDGDNVHCFHCGYEGPSKKGTFKSAADESYSGLGKFVGAYLEAALWSSSDQSDDQGGDPLDQNYGFEDIAPESMERAKKDCADFQAKAGDLLNDVSDEQAGHDFWLTRNGHGAGFWDRGLGDVGDQLTEIAHSFGEVNLIVGDDNKLYLEGSLKKQARHASVEDYLAYLKETYIPDLMESGKVETADDFKKIVSLIESKGQDAEFVEFLTTTLIPDLYASGDEATAEDFEDGIYWMTGKAPKIKKQSFVEGGMNKTADETTKCKSCGKDFDFTGLVYCPECANVIERQERAYNERLDDPQFDVEAGLNKQAKYTGDLEKDLKAIAPYVIADGVCDNDAETSDWLVERAKAIYKANPSWGKKISKDDESARDMLTAFMAHWLEGRMKNPGMEPHLSTEAGLSDQVKSLRRKLKDLDVEKADPSEIASTVDALEKLEKRLKEQQDARQTKKDEKAKAAEEAKTVEAVLSIAPDDLDSLTEWVLNDEGLYNWAMSEVSGGADAIGDLENSAFARWMEDNAQEIAAAVNKQLGGNRRAAEGVKPVEGATREQKIQAAIDMLSKDPEIIEVVKHIEKKMATTKGHYGDYMRVLDDYKQNRTMMHIVAEALINAGADAGGVQAALGIMSGSAFGSKASRPPFTSKPKPDFGKPRKGPFSVEDVESAGYTLEPMKCKHCGVVGETTYNQGIGDANCASCGKWQKEASFDEWECPKCGDVLETSLEIRVHNKTCDGKVERVRVGSTEGGKCARCGTASGGKDMCETCKKHLKETQTEWDKLPPAQASSDLLEIVLAFLTGHSDKSKDDMIRILEDVDKNDPDADVTDIVLALLTGNSDRTEQDVIKIVRDAVTHMDREAGLSDQVKTLRKKLKELDVEKADPAQIASTVDALERMEKRLKEQQEIRKTNKEEKAKAAEEAAKTEVTAAMDKGIKKTAFQTNTSTDKDGDPLHVISDFSLEIGNNYTTDHFMKALSEQHPEIIDYLYDLDTSLSSTFEFQYRGKFGQHKDSFVAIDFFDFAKHYKTASKTEVTAESKHTKNPKAEIPFSQSPLGGFSNAEVIPGGIGDVKGFVFRVFFADMTTPGFISGVYTTEEKANEAMMHYLETGEFELYGDAEEDIKPYGSEGNVTAARSIGVKYKNILKRIVNELPITTWGDMAAKAKEAMPVEAWDTWEMADQEIERLIDDLVQARINQHLGQYGSVKVASEGKAWLVHFYNISGESRHSEIFRNKTKDEVEAEVESKIPSGWTFSIKETSGRDAVNKQASFDTKAEEVSFLDIYQQCLQEQPQPADERLAAENALSLFTGGLFDAAEGEQREKKIDQALEYVKNKMSGVTAAKEVTDKVRCNNCQNIYDENIDVCPKCKTDAYLMQPYQPMEGDVEASLHIEAATNESVIQMFATDSFPKDKMPTWGTQHLKINKEPNGWSLINYNTPIAYRSNDGKTFINTQKYSVTTSKIQNVLKQAMGGASEVSEEAMKMVMQEGGDEKKGLEMSEELFGWVRDWMVQNFDNMNYEQLVAGAVKKFSISQDDAETAYVDASTMDDVESSKQANKGLPRKQASLKDGKIVEADMSDFFDYCWAFYGPGGTYGEYFNNELKKEDLKKAINEHFQGDTVDREAVRDILFTYPQYKRKKASLTKQADKLDYETVMNMSKEQLMALPTIHSGHFDNVKFDDGKHRVSVSRMTVADGAEEDNAVSFEILAPEGWITAGLKRKADHLYGINSISAHELGNGDLEISVDEKDQEEIREFIERTDDTSDQAMFDAFEKLLGNGYSWVAPEDIGALTSAPILSDTSFADEDNLEEQKTAKVWWYPDYAVSSPVAVLADKGRVIFTLAPADKEIQSSQKRYAKYFDQFKSSDLAGSAWELDKESRKLKRKKSTLKIQSTAEFFKSGGYKFKEGDHVWLITGDKATIIKRHAAAMSDHKEYDAIVLDSYGNKTGSSFKVSEKDLEPA